VAACRVFCVSLTTHTEHTVSTSQALTNMASLFVCNNYSYYIELLLYYLNNLFVNIFLLTDMLLQHKINKYWVIQNDCRSFNILSYTINLVEQHSKFLLHTLQVLYMCTLCDSTNINTIFEFVPNCL